MNIPLTKPYWGREEAEILVRAFQTTSGTGDGPFTKKLQARLMKILQTHFTYPVTSCTHALELAMRVMNLKPGDEVIVPGFTMTSTANAVVLAGATPVFADINPMTYCIDPTDIEKAITKKTKGMIIVHYGGMACDMKRLRKIAKAHDLFIVEDAAHAIGASYNGRPLGTLGIMGAFSFHGTKNVSCGEGGAIVTNNQKLAKSIEIFRANGTNRHDFLKGLVAKYHWVGPGSSYFLSDFLASIVYVQLGKLSNINKARGVIAGRYAEAFSEFRGKLQLPIISEGTKPNWHIYAIKLPTVSTRERFMGEMRKMGIEVSLHYAPLHSSPMGRRITNTYRALPVTEDVATTLVRFPIYPDLTARQLEYITSSARKILKKI